jgi:tRNA modification GTPase
MKTPENDTISAIITPQGAGGIAVLRLSGADSIRIADELFHGSMKLAAAGSHTVHYGRIEDGSGTLLDEALVSVFRAPHSYTAEDVVEISCHGSAYIAGRILQALVEKGARPAGPGEFTKRAFLNGRIDLSQAEAVADLVSSDSRASHALALSQLRGNLSGKISSIRQRLIDLCATLELELDFSEEGLEFIRRDALQQAVDSIQADISHLIDSFELGKICKEGFRVVLAGATNVGKSSILNALMREERAIVTEISGTTRDTIEESISIEGMKYNIIDTAGLRETRDAIEAEGIKRTRQQIENADLILLVIDPTQEIQNKRDADIVDDIIGKIPHNSIILIVNKVDISSREQLDRLDIQFNDIPIVFTSAKTGDGISELEQLLTSHIRNAKGINLGETVILSNLRQKGKLQDAQRSLGIVCEGITQGRTPELLAVDLRGALGHLSQFVGVDLSEEVLNTVFSRFCIGK